MVDVPSEVFKFMHKNKIGKELALFWISWAFVSEKGGNLKMTDQIFQKALKR